LFFLFNIDNMLSRLDIIVTYFSKSLVHTLFPVKLPLCGECFNICCSLK
jgi:hypothetical protein